jgi:hypothetical protein
VVAAGGLSFVLIAQLATLAKSKSLRISLSNARLHAFLNQALFAFKYLKATAGFGTLQSQISVTSGH